MNRRCYRLVFNLSCQAWQPVPEHARRRGKAARAAAGLVVASVLLGIGAPVLADPARNALPVPRADFVGRGSVSAPVISGNAMRIDQHSDKAVVNWASFDVGRDASVHFNQPSSSAAILNRIWDSKPSEIFGHLSANGQVYLINRNGILFGEGAKVSVASLVASALNMNDDLFMAGYLTNGRAGDTPAFYFDPAYDGTMPADAAARFGAASVVVGQGATVDSVDGGRVMLLAPTVEVGGQVHTPGGQTVIAAGAKVYLAASENENLRGILVEVDPLNPNFSTGNSDGDGRVSIDELAEVVATRGNVSIAAYAIQVDGTVRASTGATGAGSVFLQGRDMVKAKVDPASNAYSYAYANRAGEVTIGATGRVAVDVENETTDRLLDSVEAPQSRVSVTGNKILMEDGARISVPSGTVSMIATTRFDFVNGIQRLTETLPALNKTPIDVADIPASSILARGVGADDARIVIAEGATIDVSGLRGGETARGAQVSATRNQVDAKLLRAELKDAPLQRNGVLYRADASFDLRRAPDGVLDIADLSGYTALIERSMQERNTDGGTVRLVSQGGVVVDAGARIDVSGGWTRYLAGQIATTVLAADGQVFDLESADPDRIYTAIGTRRTAIPTYDEGADAGNIEVVGRQVVLDGELNGRAHAGLFQRQDPATAPQGGTLTIGAPIGEGDYATGAVVLAAGAPLGGDFDADPLGATLGARAEVTYLAIPSLAAARFQRFDVKANEDIELPVGGAWSLPALTALELTAVGDIRLLSAVHATGLNLAAVSENGSVQVGEGVVLDARGVWINDALAALTGRAPSTALRAVDGGAIRLAAARDVSLGTGSRIDVSGGAYLAAYGDARYGDAGSIELAHTGGRSFDGGVQMDGTLAGYAFGAAGEAGDGGSITLRADDVVIGATGADDTLVLHSGFFAEGGFANYRIDALWGAVEVAAGTQIDLNRQIRLLGRGARSAAGWSDALAGSTFSTLDARVADTAALTLRAEAIPEAEPAVSADELARVGRVWVGEGASIRLPAEGTVDIGAGRALVMAGQIAAPAGTVRLAITDAVDSSSGADVGYFADQGVFLTDSARVDVSGVSRVRADGRGRRSGQVLDAGTIEVSAGKGYVVAESGAQLVADGSLDQVDLADGRRIAVASAGGTLRFSSREGAVVSAKLSAQGGDASAPGGQFELRLNRDNVESVGLQSGATPYPTAPRQVIVSDTDPDLGAWQAGDPIPADVLVGRAYLSPSRLQAAAFDAISVDSDNLIHFETGSALAAGSRIELHAPVVSVADGIDASIEAPYVAFTYDDPVDVSPRSVSAGDGALAVVANTIDVTGHVGFSNLAGLTLTAAEDVRLSGVQPDQARVLSGSLVASGDVDIVARQLFATTYASFELVLPEAGARLSVRSNGREAPVPLSAGAALTLRADTIDQGGVIQLPFGALTLAAGDTLVLRDGSVTSASGQGATIPFGLLEGSDWVMPYGDGSRDLVDQSPVPTVVLEAPVVDVQDGARVDLSGGGDLTAYEFIAGSGGSQDVLAQPGTYAIVPVFASSYAPIDPVYGAGFDLAPGTRITIGAGADLPAGTYVLLPGHYALLPGAYKVTRLAGQDMLAGQASTLPLGGTVIAGTLSDGGSGAGDDRTGRWLIESGDLARARSGYSESTADTFFAARADADGSAVPRSTHDAGHLVASATASLQLDGQIRFDVDEDEAARRGGLLDIDAPQIAIGAGEAGALVLAADQLNATGAESIVIGGRRTVSAEGTTLAVGASRVVMDSAEPLHAGEIVLAATDTVEVADGSAIVADRQSHSEALAVTGDGG